MAQNLLQDKAEITLGYWGIRGLAQPIRFLLTHANVPFSEIRLGVKPDGTLLDEDADDEDWQSVKNTLEMSFPNLPFLIDASGDTPRYLSQSNAILRYLARRFDFYGDSDDERVEIDILQEEAYDLRNKIVRTAYTLGEEYDQALKEFTESSLPRYLDGLEHYLSQRDTGYFFVGTRLSLVDFVFYELIWQVSLMVPGSISPTNRPILLTFLKNFEALPNIGSYMASDDYIESPINSPWASFS